MMYHISDSATGYILQFSIYTGKNTKTTTKDKVPLGAKVVLELTANTRPGSLVAFDNFFSCVYLMEKLLNNNLFSCGTVRGTSKGLANHAEKSKSRKTTVSW